MQDFRNPKKCIASNFKIFTRRHIKKHKIIPFFYPKLYLKYSIQIWTCQNILNHNFMHQLISKKIIKGQKIIIGLTELIVLWCKPLIKASAFNNGFILDWTQIKYELLVHKKSYTSQNTTAQRCDSSPSEGSIPKPSHHVKGSGNTRINWIKSILIHRVITLYLNILLYAH